MPSWPPSAALPVVKTYQVLPSRIIEGSWAPRTSPSSGMDCWAAADMMAESRRRAAERRIKREASLTGEQGRRDAA